MVGGTPHLLPLKKKPSTKDGDRGARDWGGGSELHFAWVEGHMHLALTISASNRLKSWQINFGYLTRSLILFFFALPQLISMLKLRLKCINFFFGTEGAPFSSKIRMHAFNLNTENNFLLAGLGEHFPSPHSPP